MPTTTPTRTLSLKPSLDWLLVLVPIAVVLEVAGGPHLAIFLTAAGAILPLAGLIGRSTEQLAAEHSSAVMFALRNKVDVTLEIAIGSSTQIALFVAPALVFISLLVGHPMDFVFSTFEVAAVAVSTFLVFMISVDGRSNWLEGAQLMGAYGIMAISFYFVQ